MEPLLTRYWTRFLKGQYKPLPSSFRFIDLMSFGSSALDQITFHVSKKRGRPRSPRDVLPPPRVEKGSGHGPLEIRRPKLNRCMAIV